MWITNGSGADLYTIFAKIDGEKFTAFLVERKYPGVQPGAEEKKMGIKGSSTTAIYLDNVKVPVENVLGEIGRGHIIAFNILNLGRLKLGPFAIGGSKEVLRVSLKYAKERKAFGKSIAEFGEDSMLASLPKTMTPALSTFFFCFELLLTYSFAPSCCGG